MPHAHFLSQLIPTHAKLTHLLVAIFTILDRMFTSDFNDKIS
ncbi:MULTISPECIES: hypothetical protein [unclassified Calothrix]|nr:MULTISPECIES: hypothetical protein [unclassified Calothrix]